MDGLVAQVARHAWKVQLSSTVPSAAVVSVIIVTHNSLPALTQCLRSLPPAMGGLVWHLVVVDNASTDGSAEEACNRVPPATIIRNAKNRGFGAACNQGARVATGEWLLFLNPDVQLDVGSIPRLIEAAKPYERAGLATMRLRFPDASFQANCRNFPTIANILFSRGSLLGRLLWRRFKPAASVYTLPDYQEVTPVQAVSGTAVAIRRELFLQAGGFDERYFMFMEDTDLSNRLHLHGYSNLFVPQAGAVHGWGEGSRSGHLVRAWYHHQSVWKYFLKYQPTGFALLLLPGILFINFLLVAILPQRRK